MANGRVSGPARSILMRVARQVPSLAALFLAVIMMTGMALAQDRRIEQAYELIEVEQWDAAIDLAESVLDGAVSEGDRLAARTIMAEIRYYTEENLGPVMAELEALDAEAIALFGPETEYRVEILRPLGQIYALSDRPTDAARALTNAVRLARLTGQHPDVIQFSLLDLAEIYLDAGHYWTAAIISAELQGLAEAEYGPEDMIALEAGLLRARAHLEMGHPIESIVHVLPLYSIGKERLELELPDLLDLLNGYETELLTYADSAGDGSAKIEEWFPLAVERYEQRNAAVDRELPRYARFLEAAERDDLNTMESLARQLTERVLADDPSPAYIYEAMFIKFFKTGDVENMLVWLKRLAGMQAGFLATREIAFDDLVSDVLEQQGAWIRPSEAYDLISIAMEVADLKHGKVSPRVQKFRIARADVLLTEGRLAKAEEELTQLLEPKSLSTPSTPKIRARALGLLGEILLARNDVSKATIRLREALEVLEQVPSDLDNQIKVDVLILLAAAEARRGNLNEAIALQERSLAIVQSGARSASPTVVALLSSIASNLTQDGRLDEALEVMDRAIAMHDSLFLAQEPILDNRVARQSLLAAKALVLRQLGREEESAALLASVYGQEATRNEMFGSTMNHALAGVALANGQIEEASALLEQAFATISLDDPQRLRLLSLEARIAVENGKPRRSMELLREITTTWSAPGRRGLPDTQHHFQFHAAVAAYWAERLGDDPSAAALMDEAFALAQRANSLRAGQALRSSSTRWSVAGLAPLLRELQEIENAIPVLETDFSRALATGEVVVGLRSQIDEKLARAEVLRWRIETAFPDYTSFVAAKPVDAPSAAQWLRPDEVLVLYSSGDEAFGERNESSLIIALTNDAIVTAPTASRTDLLALANALRCEAARTDPRCGVASVGTRGAFSLDQGSKPAEPPFDTGLAHEAYLTLLEPVADALQGKSTLIVVPDAALVSLPFHLLVTRPPDGEDGLEQVQWLIRDMTVFVAPSVGSLDALRRREKSKNTASLFLGIGDPLVGIQIDGAVPYDCSAGEDRQLLASALSPQPGQLFNRRGSSADLDSLARLAALPETRCELTSLRAHFSPASELLLQESATEGSVKEMSAKGELEKFQVISFATHGLIAGEIGANDAGLVLTPPVRPSESDDGLLTSAEIGMLKLNADMVLLSACNTAAGTARSDEGLSGMANAFFFAGARSLLVSHWPVYSDAAVDLTTRIFAHMADDPALGYAEALRRAMLEILDDPDASPSKRHPSYWAPFIVVGEGGSLR